MIQAGSSPREAYVVLGDGAGQDEDAGAYDDADTEDGQIQRGQGLLERVLWLLGIEDGLLDLLRPEECDAHGRTSHAVSSST